MSHNKSGTSFYIDKRVSKIQLTGGVDCDLDVSQYPDLHVRGGARIKKKLCAGEIIATKGITSKEYIKAPLICGDLNGTITGDVLGNVLGDVLGNVIGDVTGDVLGNVLGSFKGTVQIDATELGEALADSFPPILMDPSLMDAFGRQKVSNPYTLLDTKFLTNKKPEIWDELLVSGGTAIFSPGYIRLNVTTNGDRVVRQTRTYNPYQPGKGLVAYITGTLETTGNLNIISRIGMYDNHADKNNSLDTEASGNGYFFQVTNGIVSVVERTYITGSQVDTVIPQTNWNYDKFDGTGPSGITLDYKKRQIFVIELEWLGVGTAALGFFTNRKLYFAHIFYHANIDDTLPYITRPTLPIRYELESIGHSGALIQVCATVVSDGGYTPIGNVYSTSVGAGAVSVSMTETAVLSLRLKTSRKRVTLSIINASLQSDTANNVLYRIYRFLPPVTALTSPTWNSVNDNSAAEFSIGPTTFTSTNGIRLADQYVNNQTNAQFLDLSEKFGIIAVSDIIGDSDVIIITAQAFSGTPKVFASIQWQELE